MNDLTNFLLACIAFNTSKHTLSRLGCLGMILVLWGRSFA